MLNLVRVTMIFLFIINGLSYSLDKHFNEVMKRAENLNPTQFLDELRSIKKDSITAKAFLSCYGGADFHEEEDFADKQFPSEVYRNISNISGILGKIYYNRGAQSWDDDSSLKFASVLLNNNGIDVLVRDFNSSLRLSYRLFDMQQNRQRLSEALKNMRLHAEELQKSEKFKTNPKDEELEKALAEIKGQMNL